LAEKQEPLEKLQEQLLHTSRMEDICDHLMEAAAELTQCAGLALFLRCGETSEFEQKRLAGCFPEIPGSVKEELFDSTFLRCAFGAEIAGEMIYKDRKYGFFLVCCQECDKKEVQGEKCLRLLCTLGMLALRSGWYAGEAWIKSVTDDVTGAYNRRYLLKRLNEDMGNSVLQAALIDINVDDFKLYNEMYGYMQSDSLLQFVADIIRGEKSTRGELYRFGADEFLLLEPGMAEAQALETAERIRKKIRQVSKDKKKLIHPLTVSCGIVLFPENVAVKEDLLGSCSRAVYYAKVRGKNQTALWKKEDHPREGSGYYRSSFEKIAPTIYAFMAAVDAKDQITFRHSLKVSEYATTLAQALGLKEEEVEIIREAGLLHDIGKIGIPENILKKQSFLTEEEYAVMKEHVKNATEMIRFLPDMNYVLPAVVAHHERYDGKGYPSGLAGEDIPLGGRCLAIADSFDTMTARRPYKEPMRISYAVRELEKGKNTQFDPYLTDVFLQLIEEGKIRVWNGQEE